jgi:hypothetical protein
MLTTEDDTALNLEINNPDNWQCTTQKTFEEHMFSIALNEKYTLSFPWYIFFHL